MNSKAVHSGEPHSKLRVVIVGAGFGGLNAAETLAGAAVKITVIDRKNHHTFQPLLYQVATAGLSPGEIASPIRSILSRHRNIEVLMAEVSGFDLTRRVVQITDSQNATQEIAYDFLIVAAGASHAYFGHDEWQSLAPGLKTIEDAIEIRRRVLLAFELAERNANAADAAGQQAGHKPKSGHKEEPLNFVVVGAGPTGVELAGTLAEICRHALADDFRAIDPSRTRIHLIEGGPRVLPAYPEDLSRSALNQLQRLGVEVVTSTMVTKIEPGAITMGDQRMEAAVILWAAGVAASPLGKKLGVPVDRAGRVLVQSDLSLPRHPEVFVIGDLAALNDASGKLLPGVAPVAILEGRYVARVIRHEISGAAKHAPRKPFHYFDKGSLATIGRAAAVAQFGKVHISGFLAWLAWLFVHILFLIGFRNRLLVFIQWAWSYFTYERGARLITGGTTLPGWNESQAQNSRAGEAEPEMSAAIDQ
ncbi:MAG TPA: NAD(P)/FAD-dependent oxidoreductase [Candidatus Acidoferrum sp.]|jgi:NADH dehydrogenase|nr:NAD(P)/FAD-dependent oxidoreductase [Candidatus Acidoferrum sp.]